MDVQGDGEKHIEGPKTATLAGHRKLEISRGTDKNMNSERLGTHGCSVSGCGGRKKPIFNFPRPEKNLPRFRQWVHAAHNERFVGLTDEQISKRGFVCYRHFEPIYYEDRPGTRAFLQSVAVPTLNLHPDVQGTTVDLRSQVIAAQPTDFDIVLDPSDRQLVEDELLQNLNIFDPKFLDFPDGTKSTHFQFPVTPAKTLGSHRNCNGGDQNSCSIVRDEDIDTENGTYAFQIKSSGLDKETGLENYNISPLRDEDVDTEVFQLNVCSVRDEDTSLETCTEPQSSVLPLQDDDVDLENGTEVFQLNVSPVRDEDAGLQNYNGNIQLSEEMVPNMETQSITIPEFEKPYFKSVKTFWQGENRMTEVCRICFQSLEEEKVIKLYEESSNQDPVQIKMLIKLVLPDLDLEIYPNVVICVNCAELLVYSYQLKEKWLCTEEKLQKIVSKKKGVIDRDADLVIIGKKVAQNVPSETDHTYAESSPREKVPQLDTEVLLQNLSLQSHGKCLFENAVMFHGNLVDDPVLLKRRRVGARKPKERKPHICEICGRVYPDRANFQRHLQSHKSQEATHLCDICGHLCSTVGGLRAHKQRKHLGTKCKFCNRVVTNGQLDFHMTSEHLGEAFQCHLCGRSYKHRRGLNQHLKIHDPARNSYACNLCDRKFFLRGSLRKHLRSHDEDMLRCDYCGKLLKCKWSLDQHVRIKHFKESTVVCEFCKTRYWKVHDLERHMIRVHGFSEEANEESCAVKNLQQVLALET